MDTKAKDATDEEVEFESYTILPAGMYRCRLEGISSEEMQFGPTLRFKWRVLEGDQEGEEVSGLANKKLLPKSKLALWSKAHLDISTFPEGFVLKLNSLIGKEVFITLGIEPRADGGGERNVIRAVDPVRPNAKKATKATKANDGFNSMLSDEEIPDPGEPLRKGERKVQD